MTRRILILATAAMALSSSAALAKPSGKGWCNGTFARHSCMNGTGTGGTECAYPRKAGDKDEFMGWSVEDGQRVYVIYRMGAYPAANIAIDEGCRLREWK